MVWSGLPEMSRTTMPLSAQRSLLVERLRERVVVEVGEGDAPEIHLERLQLLGAYRHPADLEDEGRGGQVLVVAAGGTEGAELLPPAAQGGQPQPAGPARAGGQVDGIIERRPPWRAGRPGRSWRPRPAVPSTAGRRAARA